MTDHERLEEIRIRYDDDWALRIHELEKQLAELRDAVKPFIPLRVFDDPLSIDSDWIVRTRKAWEECQ